MSELTRDEWVARHLARSVHPQNFARNPEHYTWAARKLYERVRLQQAVKRGEVVKPSSCSTCPRTDLSSREIHAHHTNYHQPLVVQWLCRWCHESKHKGRHISTPLASR